MEISNWPDGEGLHEVIGKYPSVFNNTVRRTHMVEHGIRLANVKLVTINSYPYRIENIELISNMILIELEMIDKT